MPRHIGMATGSGTMNVRPLTVVFCAFLIAAPGPLLGQGPDGVDALVFGVGADGLPQLRLRAPAGADLRHFELTGPHRLVLDVPSTSLSAAAPDVPDGLRQRVRGIRVARFSADVVRVVVDLASPEPYAVDRQGPWWVVTLTGVAAAQTADPVADRPQVANRPQVAEPAPQGVTAQEPTPLPNGTLEVKVVRVAGSAFYINAGTRQGLGTGQSVQAERQVGRGRGTLEVLSTTSSTALLSFSGRAFAVTRGDGLRLTLPQTRGPDRALGAAETEESATEADTPPSSDRAPLDGVWGAAPERHGARLHGTGRAGIPFGLGPAQPGRHTHVRHAAQPRSVHRPGPRGWRHGSGVASEPPTGTAPTG